MACYDIEEKSQFKADIHNSIDKAFCKILEAEKYYCGIYASGSHWSSDFDDEVKKNIQFGLHIWR